MDELHQEIERRKAAKINPCVYCGGTGGYAGMPCRGCLGHGIILTDSERRALLNLTETLEDFQTDRILEQQDFDQA